MRSREENSDSESSFSSPYQVYDNDNRNVTQIYANQFQPKRGKRSRRIWIAFGILGFIILILLLGIILILALSVFKKSQGNRQK